MCLVLKLDLRCCSGCREWMCRNLKRVHGVQQVELGDDEITTVVYGEGIDEAEIVQVVKKRKRKSKLVVSRIFHNGESPPDRDVGARPADVIGLKPKVKPFDGTEECAERKPMATDVKEKQPESKPIPKPEVFDGEEQQPKLKPTVLDGEEEQQQQSNSPRKVETLVMERLQEEIDGTKIRTRVTTSQELCTCIRVEETHFIINKDRFHIPTNA